MTRKPIDHLTLTQIEARDWGSAPADATGLVRTILELRHKPLAQFTAEDLRICIGQDVGLPSLMPRALDLLEREPLAEGDHYAGDLLCNVLRASPEYFRANAEQRERARALIAGTHALARQLEEADALTFEKAFAEALREFEAGWQER